MVPIVVTALYPNCDILGRQNFILSEYIGVAAIQVERPIMLPLLLGVPYAIEASTALMVLYIRYGPAIMAALSESPMPMNSSAVRNEVAKHSGEIASVTMLTAVILLASKAQDQTGGQAALIAAMVAVSIVTLACLMGAGAVQRFIGKSGLNILARVMGVVLAAMSVQFIADGIRGMNFH